MGAPEAEREVGTGVRRLSGLWRLAGAFVRRAPVRLALFSLLALVGSWTALGGLGRTNEFRDAHVLHTYDIVAERSLREYGQWPLWNPWSCGGMYLPGNPQSKSASPATLLSFAMGARASEGAMLLLFLVLGMEGFHRYVRLRSRTALGAVLAAPLFVLSGHFAFSWSLGWVQFLGYLLLPWALVGVTRLVRGRADGLLYTGLAFALMLGFGGTYPVPLSAIFVVLEAARALLERKRRAPLSVAVPLLVAGALFTVGLCLFRFWPVLETMAQGPRVMAGSPKHAAGDLLRMFFGLASSDARSDSGTFFVAPVAGVFALAAFATRGTRLRAVFPLLGLGLAFWLATGYAVRPSAFEALRSLPVYETIRYPARFLVFAGLYLAELAALGLFAVGVLLRRARSETALGLRLPRVMAVVGPLAVLLVLGGWGFQLHAFDALTRRTELGYTLPREPQPFAQARGNRWVSLHFTAIDRGSLSCGEAYPVPMSPLLGGNLPAEEYALEPDAATVERVEWTPNRLVLRVDAERPARVLVNQNYHPGWRADVGTAVSHEGLLAVDVPGGLHTVTLRFLPRSAIGGAAVSLLALILAVGAVTFARRTQRASIGAWLAVGLGLLPLGATAAVAAMWKEPVLAPRLTNPDGGPIVVEALPTDATPLDVRFALPVRLVAARVPAAPDERGIVPLELYWVVDGPVPRSVGIFVHLPGPSDRKSADHEVVAGTYFFKNAPRGVLLRDSFGVSAHDWKAGSWRVHVGLWHASGDGSRVPLFDAHGTPLTDARVDVGGFEVPETTPPANAADGG